VTLRLHIIVNERSLVNPHINLHILESAYANGNIIMDAQALTAYRQEPEAFEDVLDCVFLDMGIRHFVFAVNKMDLVGYDRDSYMRLEKDIRKLAIDLDLEGVTVIPVSTTEGDNITRLSPNMKW